MFQKMLAATEDPTFCDAKVQTAAALANKRNGKLYILHVLESTSSMYRNFVRHFRTGEEIVTNAAYEEEVRKEIEKHCAPFSNRYEIHVTDGFPWEEIAKYERNQDIDLIVLGPHAESRKPLDVQRVVGRIGSTTEGVMHHVHCPVMLVNRPVSERQLLFKNILAAVDYSESCKYALRFAFRLASASDAALYVFYMLPSDEDSQGASRSRIQEHTKRLEAFCLSTANGLKAEYNVAVGKRPHLEILKFAGEKNVDLIALGSHTKKENDGKWYPGSVVEGVGALSHCPVVVVTDPEALTKMEK